ELWALYGSLGYENGILGYPKAAAVAINSTDYTQQFEGGTITYTQAGGARLTSATDPWTNTILTTTYLGSPTRGKACGLVRSGCWQSFQGGYVYSTPTYGPVAFKSELWALYGSLGYENGILGYPKAAAVAINSTDYSQEFEGGFIRNLSGQISYRLK
ncbi:uncharacterized protein with LGFP repeats, partial [Aurantimicrobium minutum]|uniref:LGFP repeat-containing protein n=1 Tax=Aurantimicrobium minutum TaxID=708131 RepID=UPI003D66383D|nr:uncharacterized protein with LGFP repeats [Aurantimicrobium minutum]